MPVQQQSGLADQIDGPLGQLGNHIHSTGGGIQLLFGSCLMNAGHDLLMVGIHSILSIVSDEGQSLLSLITELLFHHKSHGNIVPLINPVVADESVHSGAQNESTANCRTDHMKVGIFIRGSALVLPGKICIQGTKIHIYGDVSLIVAAVGHNAGHNAVHRGQILQPYGIPAVTRFSFLLFHCNTSAKGFPHHNKNRRELQSAFLTASLLCLCYHNSGRG